MGAPRIDPEDLRAYARRDWGAPERLARAERAALPVEKKVEIAIALYEAARAGGVPDPRQREADLRSHLRVRALLDRASHVGAR